MTCRDWMDMAGFLDLVGTMVLAGAAALGVLGVAVWVARTVLCRYRPPRRHVRRIWLP